MWIQHTSSITYMYVNLQISHLDIEAPESFNISSSTFQYGYKQNTKAYNRAHSHNCSHKTEAHPTISTLEHMQDMINTNFLHQDKVDLDDDDDSFNVPHKDIDIPSEYAPIIAAYFRCTHNIICDACGSKGHHAPKCYKRGINFLPRDIQQRIIAYNEKYRSSPKTDSSPDLYKSYHTLDPPSFKLQTHYIFQPLY